MGDRHSALSFPVTRLLIEFVLLALIFAALPRINGTTDASDGTFFLLIHFPYLIIYKKIDLSCVKFVIDGFDNGFFAWII